MWDQVLTQQLLATGNLQRALLCESSDKYAILHVFPLVISEYTPWLWELCPFFKALQLYVCKDSCGFP